LTVPSAEALAKKAPQPATARRVTDFLCSAKWATSDPRGYQGAAAGVDNDDVNEGAPPPFVVAAVAAVAFVGNSELTAAFIA